MTQLGLPVEQCQFALIRAEARITLYDVTAVEWELNR